LPRQYSSELRRFVITLHYYLPRAYSYVRQKFHACLPHAKTILKWYKSVDGKPGFNMEALETISKHVKSVDYVPFGALIFDEMSIRQHVEFNGTKFCGYVDLGPNVETDITNVAKDALFFFSKCFECMLENTYRLFFNCFYKCRAKNKSCLASSFSIA